MYPCIAPTHIPLVSGRAHTPAPLLARSLREEKAPGTGEVRANGSEKSQLQLSARILRKSALRKNFSNFIKSDKVVADDDLRLAGMHPLDPLPSSQVRPNSEPTHHTGEGNGCGMQSSSLLTTLATQFNERAKEEKKAKSTTVEHRQQDGQEKKKRRGSEAREERTRKSRANVTGVLPPAQLFRRFNFRSLSLSLARSLAPVGLASSQGSM